MAREAEIEAHARKNKRGDVSRTRSRIGRTHVLGGTQPTSEPPACAGTMCGYGSAVMGPRVSWWAGWHVTVRAQARASTCVDSRTQPARVCARKPTPATHPRERCDLTSRSRLAQCRARVFRARGVCTIACGECKSWNTAAERFSHVSPRFYSGTKPKLNALYHGHYRPKSMRRSGATAVRLHAHHRANSSRRRTCATASPLSGSKTPTCTCSSPTSHSGAWLARGAVRIIQTVSRGLQGSACRSPALVLNAGACAHAASHSRHGQPPFHIPVH